MHLKETEAGLFASLNIYESLAVNIYHLYIYTYNIAINYMVELGKISLSTLEDSTIYGHEEMLTKISFGKKGQERGFLSGKPRQRHKFQATKFHHLWKQKLWSLNRLDSLHSSSQKTRNTDFNMHLIEKY